MKENKEGSRRLCEHTVYAINTMRNETKGSVSPKLAIRLQHLARYVALCDIMPRNTWSDIRSVLQDIAVAGDDLVGRSFLKRSIVAQLYIRHDLGCAYKATETAVDNFKVSFAKPERSS